MGKHRSEHNQKQENRARGVRLAYEGVVEPDPKTQKASARGDARTQRRYHRDERSH